MNAATEPSNAPRIIATAGNYLQLIAAFRARLVELGLNYETVDELSGWTTRYCSKLLAEEPARNLGPMSLDAILGATGLKIALVEDPEKLEKIKRHRDFRPRKYAVRARGKHAGYIVRRDTLEHMRRMGIEGGRARAEKLSERKRSAIARKAAKARWRKPRLVEVKPNSGA